ncbi:probable cytochrome P450 6a13 isoform X1 [Diorhabda carinulata]|uniref:probable cytochrome P450 6a13 isoform X1 n=2 Tax=Diorhabda carinulata TaxID=1163345 RepID=UPI0025A11035|nr:probable cytochrome P450 6a13 isoform X1 [Diorhabda carinulata]
MIITSSFSYDFIISITTLIAILFFYIKYKYSFWKTRGIPQLTPTFPFGNYVKSLPKGIALGAVTKRYYDAFKKMGCKFGGVYIGLDPYLVIMDPNYAKDILVKDFQYFVDRNLYCNEKDRITANIISKRGNEWRAAREKFSVLFTTAKLKQYFSVIEQCTENLKQTLKPFSKGDVDLNIYDVLSCYTTDAIGTVFLGVAANSFDQSDGSIRKTGKEFFSELSIIHRIRLFLTICYPNLAANLKISNIDSHIQKFYANFIREILKFREKNQVNKNDLIQMVVEMKQSGMDLTLDEMISEILFFYLAAYETSSGTASFILLELALHQDVQDKVREEIIQVTNKYNGKLTFEAVNELTYLRQVFDETGRKYPTLATIGRICVKDYTFKNCDITIKKGMSVIIPVLGYHHDADYYPDPSKWDPDRFADKNERHEGYLMFGAGPRNCIGSRYGVIQVILGLASILEDYQVFVSPNTELPLVFDELTFVTKMKQTIYLRLKKLEN